MISRGAGALAVLLALAAAPAAAQEAGADPADRPSIVVILADDLGYGDLSSYGHPTIRTPNLDRMAAEGIRLTSFYSAAPVCTPSRAGLLTGRLPVRTGLTQALLHDASVGLPDSEVTVAEALKARGYRTAHLGKWHLGHLPQFSPTRHGFDRFFGIPYSNDVMEPWVEGAPPVPLLRGTQVVEQPLEQPSFTARLTDEAVSFIRDSGEEPFFLYLAYSMPHLPIHASEAFRGRSRAGAYGDVIEEIDASVGRILSAVRESGADGRTLVLFTSDNGPWLNAGARMMQGGVEPWHVGSPGPLRGSKATTYEGGMRVPGIVRWPGVIPAGQVSAEIASFLDLFPTFLGMAGAPLPPGRPLDGSDLLPMLTGRAPSPRREVLYFLGRRLESVREGPWKLRLVAPAGQPAAAELFNLDVDPSERHDLSAVHPAIVARLRARVLGAGF